jgi:L-galactose dehydrogenase
MIYSTLGRTPLQVSRIGFGAATLGDEYGRLDPAEGRRAVNRAIDRGINFFDVSPYYGRTLAESRLGEYLRGRRHGVVLATKVGRYDRDPPDGFDFSAARVVSSVEQSLQRLCTDVIDLFLAHDIEFAPPGVVVGETLPAMRRLQEAGKVRHIGITGYPLEVLRRVMDDFEVDAILSYCHFSLLNTRLGSLAESARARGTGVINASPLHMGALTDAGPPSWHPAPAPVLRAAREAASFCRSRGVDLADLALRFALRGPADVTLVGLSSELEVDRCIAALERDGGEEMLAAVQSILAPVANIEWAVGMETIP